MPYIGSGTYSPLIITPEMQTPAASLLDAAAAYHRSQAAQWAEVQQARETANTRREQAIVSPGSQAMHTAQRQVVQYIRIVKDLHLEVAGMYDQQASALRYVDQQQANIDRAAHEKISQVKSKAEIPAIVAQHNLSAKTITSRTAAEIQAQNARWTAGGGAELMSLGSRIAQDTPRDPIKPTPNPSPGIVTPLGHRRDRDRPAVPDDRGTAKAEQPGDAEKASDSGNLGKRAGQGLGNPDQQYERINKIEAAGNGAGSPSYSPAPSRASSSPLSGGGIGSGGSGLGSGMGSGGSGLGSGMGSNPLSSMMGGLGQNPASSMTNGLSGATNPASGASNASNFNPASAFAKGLSGSGSSIAPMTNSAVPPPVAASAANPSVAGPQALSAVTPASSAPAAAGMHTPSVAAGGTGGGSPMMLPSTGMGAPAAGATASATPVGSSSTSAAGGAGAAVAAGGAAGNAGPTLVPAGVVSAAASAQPGRMLSPDALAAAALAWQLQHACRSVGFPMDWAVGVFRSEHGSETVVMSAEGSGYVPAGVYVPRNARLLVADPLVDKAFRDEWFGWPDPAQVMVEYARRRSGSGWELVAAATNGPVEHFRNCGVEYADSCTYERSPLSVDHPAPVLDEMHAHRLQLEYPDLYDRLVRLSGAAQVYIERVMVPMTAALVTTARGMEHPVQLAHVWSMIVNGGAPSHEQWAEYAQVASTDFLTTTVHRPETPGGPEEWKTVVYREAWTVSRAMECVAGWAASPMPLADMVYAVAAADPGADAREVIGTTLRGVEGELGWL